MAATRIVCLGDSITWGFPHGQHCSWVRMLGDDLGIPVINQGINGDTVGGMLRRFDHSVLTHNPSHLIVMGGINDVFGGHSYPMITGNLQKIAERAVEHNIQVVFGTPTAVDYPELERLLWRLRDWIMNYAGDNEMPVIPFHRAFIDDDGEVKTELLLADGGHPTEAGFTELYQMIDLSIFR